MEDHTYQEECIRHESVPKHGPAHPAAGSLSTVENGGDGNGHDYADEFVARVCDQVVDLAFRVDVQKVASKPKQDELQNDDHTGIAESDSQQLGLELSVQSCNHGRKQDICGESHDRDVDVRAVDVVPGGQERRAAS